MTTDICQERLRACENKFESITNILEKVEETQHKIADIIERQNKEFADFKEVFAERWGKTIVISNIGAGVIGAVTTGGILLVLKFVFKIPI